MQTVRSTGLKKNQKKNPKKTKSDMWVTMFMSNPAVENLFS